MITDDRFYLVAFLSIAVFAVSFAAVLYLHAAGC